MQAWLNEALDYIPGWLDYQMRQSRQPGCAIAVAHKGKLVLQRAFGFADATAKKKLTPRHRFRAASHSKSFTAAGILKLREANLIRLDDPVGAYVEGLYGDVATSTIGQLSHARTRRRHRAGPAPIPATGRTDGPFCRETNCATPLSGNRSSKPACSSSIPISATPSPGW